MFNKLSKLYHTLQKSQNLTIPFLFFGYYNQLMARVLLIIAQTDFRDEELFETKKAIEKAGHQVEIASTHRGRCFGSGGGIANASLNLDEVNPLDYKAIVFVGGAGSAVYFDNRKALAIVKDCVKHGLILAAICLAPMILAYAGVLEGKRVTVTSSKIKSIEMAGAVYAGPGVIVDGNIITGDGPESSKFFGEKVASLIV